MSACVQVEVGGPIATVRLDGPERHNVLDLGGWRALASAMHEVSADGEGRCVVLRGAGGRAFSAGSDITGFADTRDAPEDVRAYSRAIAAALGAVRACRHPVVALIEGLCVGGGLEIAAACDVRVCGASSRFGAPINRLGVTMAHDEVAPLVDLLGPGPVLEILLTGDLVDAARAREMGLVARVFADETLVEEGYALARRIAAGAPLVNRWHKRFVYRLLDPRPLTDEERAEPLEAFETEDYREGREAFLARRPPEFRGR
jgi:Enoyl-CoA hydratase/carnithine racemase